MTKTNQKLLNFRYCLDFYFKSLFIALRPFLPSFRILKKSQVREKIIKKVSEIREMKVISI